MTPEVVVPTNSIALSDAANRIRTSAANAASQRARELRLAGHDVIDLTTGEPDFPTPDHICEAAHRAMLAGQTRYTAVDGTLELKTAIASKFKRDNDLHYSTNEICVSAGAKQIIFNALLATLNPGDEVLIPIPCWVSYPEMVSLTGATPVTVPNEECFEDAVRNMEQAITPRTKWLMFNSPNNPSGTALSDTELRMLADMLLRHPHVLVMSDDIYEHVLFDGRKFNTIAAIEPRLKARTLTINGVSKAYSMTGWRIGYAGGPAALIRAMAKIQSQSTSAPSSISQAAALAALAGPQDIVHERTAILEKRRDLLIKEFDTIKGMHAYTPDGAFYLFLDCRELLPAVTSKGQQLNTDYDLVTHFVNEAGVALVHGTPFGAPGYLRLSFAASEADLINACERLRATCSQLL